MIPPLRFFPISLDALAIPVDAPHPEEAYALIDYLLRPEVAAKSTNYLGYANGDTPDPKLISKSVIEDRTVYPDEATLKNLYTISAHDQKTPRVMNRLWTRIKTGK